jgi:hypothetical protein
MLFKEDTPINPTLILFFYFFLFEILLSLGSLSIIIVGDRGSYELLFHDQITEAEDR